MRRRLSLLPLTAGILLLGAGPALACAGLIGSNGSVNLIRTTTLAAYHDGVEHYLTAFRFFGGGGAFGSIIPLPAAPTKVERGGDWTLQRLVRETQPQPKFAVPALQAADGRESAPAKVLLETRIDALDITVLEGGAFGVGEWARQNGFDLPPDAPEVLDFYASRSPYFMAARFDAEAARARGQEIGDGTPIHLTIPTENPWVPLRILGLGKAPEERIAADVYLLTDRRPALLPESPGLILEQSTQASDSLMADLASDKGMEWMPESMWLSYLRIDASAGELGYDLAVDASGAGKPSRTAAGLPEPAQFRTVEEVARTWWPVLGLAAVMAVFASGAWALGRLSSHLAG
ncbi:MAG: DUF2330 domain-containing protein [Actinomycetota bacterium]